MFFFRRSSASPVTKSRETRENVGINEYSWQQNAWRHSVAHACISLVRCMTSTLVNEQQRLSGSVEGCACCLDVLPWFCCVLERHFCANDVWTCLECDAITGGKFCLVLWWRFEDKVRNGGLFASARECKFYGNWTFGRESLHAAFCHLELMICTHARLNDVIVYVQNPTTCTRK